MLTIVNIDHDAILKKAREVALKDTTNEALPKNTTVTMFLNVALPDPEETFAKMREDGLLPPKEPVHLSDKVSKIRNDSQKSSGCDNKLKK